MRWTLWRSWLLTITWYGRREASLTQSMLCLIVGPLQFILGWHGNVMTRYVFHFQHTGVRQFRKTYSDCLQQFTGPAASFIFTFRTPDRIETTIYGSPRAIWWNSEHLAYRFGKPIEGDPRFEGGAIYDGWMGYHIAC
jgi:hypothetical protein